MKTVKIKTVFQGDVCFRRAKAIPPEFKRQERNGALIVAHSETSHHHVIDDVGVIRFDAGDPLRCFLQLESADHCDVVHKRPFDTHETVRLGGGKGAIYEVIRQREYSPAGWRMVSD